MLTGGGEKPGHMFLPSASVAVNGRANSVY